MNTSDLQALLIQVGNLPNILTAKIDVGCAPAWSSQSQNPETPTTIELTFSKSPAIVSIGGGGGSTGGWSTGGAGGSAGPGGAAGGGGSSGGAGGIVRNLHE